MNRTAIGLALSLSLSVAARADVPKVLSFTGTLSDAAGNPVPDGDHDITFRFFQSVSSGTAFWQNVYPVQTVSGVFTALLGTNSVPLDPSLFAVDQVWLEIEVAGDVLVPRTRVVSVPYALAAASVDCDGCVQAAQVDLSEVQGRVSGTCSGGQAVGAVNENGTVVCVSAGGGLTPGPGIDISGGVISSTLAERSCPSPEKVCGFDAAGDRICCGDLADLGFMLPFDCPGTFKVHGWDSVGNPLCEAGGGGGGGVEQVLTGAGLTGGPIDTTSPMGTISIATGGVQTSMIAPSAVSETVGIADRWTMCRDPDPSMRDVCVITTAAVVLFERTVNTPGIYMFHVHLNSVTHDLQFGGYALGLQLNNATAFEAVDPDPSLGETWDYTFTVTTPPQSISRVFVYEKVAAGPETLEVKAWTNGGTATIEPYSDLGGYNAGMHVIALKR